MKNKLMLLAIASLMTLTGCAAYNEVLGNSQKFEVFQVMENMGALARRCESEYGCYGMTVFLLNEVDPMMFNDKIVVVNDPVIVKTWTYQTRLGENTVPVITDQSLADVPLEKLR